MMAVVDNEHILDYTLVPASTSEQKALMTLVDRAKLTDIQAFGDKGFQMNAYDKEILKDKGIDFSAIPRANMKVKVENLRFKRKARKRIETNFSQLVSIFDLTGFFLRSIFGFAASIIQKILAYNVSVTLKSAP